VPGTLLTALLLLIGFAPSHEDACEGFIKRESEELVSTPTPTTPSISTSTFAVL